MNSALVNCAPFYIRSSLFLVSVIRFFPRNAVSPREARGEGDSGAEIEGFGWSVDSGQPPSVQASRG
jgi:hypothetical protein